MAVAIPGMLPTAAAAVMAKDSCSGDGLRRTESAADFAGIRRSRSEPVLRCSLIVPRAAELKSSRSVGIFPFQLNGSFLPKSVRSFLFETEEAAAEMQLVDPEDSDEDLRAEEGLGKRKRANWVERLLELRYRWRDRQKKDEEEGEGEEEEEGDGDYYCGANYDSEEEEGDVGQKSEWDRDSFTRLLARVPWSDAKLFSQLATLCNMAYLIPEIKAEDLKKYYDLRFVTSSLEKKSEASAIKSKLEVDSTQPPPTAPAIAVREPRRQVRPSVAYEIAASAASYVQSRAKGLLSLGGKPGPHPDDAPAEGTRCEGAESSPSAAGNRVYKSEVAAYVAASAMTAVVAAEEEARQEAAMDLRSLHSSPCEWFVCDEPATRTRCFFIQGSDSLASWQANLFFEPTKFEDTGVLVHRGIYEAAKGIYEQFMPEIESHVKAHGDRARLRFSGHSLGGSLALLVSLMLLARGAVGPLALLPVVTFGAPSVFCGGQRVLESLGVDEGHVRSVMMHRDIVPRAFSCSYPHHVALVLKRLNGAFRSHPCLNNEKVLYSPLGKTYILQPDEKSSPSHPLLPQGAALYSLDPADANSSLSKSTISSALRAFINSPHPLETLSDPSAYGSEGTILRDHESINYVKAINGLLRQHTKSVVRRSREKRLRLWWPLLTSNPNGLTGQSSWVGHSNSTVEKGGLASKELVTGT
ncbi:phospholipase A1 PLIP1, chloroplastic [Typha latifolia]|uniref:phospholipase A1 PLIP1, chloroplastic n=1 Tax=Typha latifolia TaxID=4733 RepID=UPI003C2EC101